MTTRSKKVYALAGALLAFLLVGAGVLVFEESACRCPLCAIHNPFLFAGLVLAAAAWIAWTLVSIRRESVRRLEQVRRLSHDLKTPLTNLRLYSDLLARGKLKSSEDVSDAHKTLQQESEKLGELVDKLIEFGNETFDERPHG